MTSKVCSKQGFQLLLCVSIYIFLGRIQGASIRESELKSLLIINQTDSEHRRILLFAQQIEDQQSESEVAQSCLTLFGPMDCSLPGSSVHGIFQARVLEWVTISFCQSRKCFKNSRVTGRKPNALIARQNESTSERENCMELLESNATQRKHICGRIIKQNQQ